MLTIDGARALGLDGQTGSLEPGKRADVVVLRPGLHAGPGGRPAGRVVYSCTPADVQHVFVDGELLVRDGRLTRWDEAEVAADADREVRRVLDRAGLA
jgi:cytosine/adenosine deaminase-related metal-dependent hydrolase